MGYNTVAKKHQFHHQCLVKAKDVFTGNWRAILIHNSCVCVFVFVICCVLCVGCPTFLPTHTVLIYVHVI